MMAISTDEEELPASQQQPMDVDNNNQVAMKYGIRSIPTLLLFKDGEVVDQVIGNVGKDSIESMLEKAL